MARLEQALLDERNIFLVDGSAREDTGFCIGREIYDARQFQHLNQDVLAKAIRQMRKLSRVFSCPCAFTISEVTENLKKLVEIVSEKIGYNAQRARLNRNKKAIERGEKPEHLIRILQQAVYNAYTTAKSKEIERWQSHLGFDIDPQKLDLLFSMTTLLDEKIHLKKDTNVLYGWHDTDMSRASDTDEKMVAMLYYLSMFSGRKPKLLTCNTDFVRLLGVTPRLIGSDEFMPHNEQFREALHKNPIQLYLKNLGRTYELAFNSRNVEYNPLFVVNCLTETDNSELKDRFAEMWRHFSFSAVGSGINV